MSNLICETVQIPDLSFVKKLLVDVIEDMKADEKIFSHYFSSDYMQYVDGHILNYTDFVHHMLAQKVILKSARVTIDHCVISKSSFCTVHKVDARKKNGESILIKVIAYFEMKNGKITLCDELTYLINGEKEDQSIGSAR